jgi:hypothetical protein
MRFRDGEFRELKYCHARWIVSLMYLWWNGGYENRSMAQLLKFDAARIAAPEPEIWKDV